MQGGSGSGSSVGPADSGSGVGAAVAVLMPQSGSGKVARRETSGFTPSFCNCALEARTDVRCAPSVRECFPVIFSRGFTSGYLRRAFSARAQCADPQVTNLQV